MEVVAREKGCDGSQWDAVADGRKGSSHLGASGGKQRAKSYVEVVEVEAGSRWTRRMWSLRLSTRLEPCGQ